MTLFRCSKLRIYDEVVQKRISSVCSESKLWGLIVTRKSSVFPYFSTIFFWLLFWQFYFTLIYHALSSILLRISLKIQVKHKIFGSNPSCALLSFGPNKAPADLPVKLEIARPPPSQCPKIDVGQLNNCWKSFWLWQKAYCATLTLAVGEKYGEIKNILNNFLIKSYLIFCW